MLRAKLTAISVSKSIQDNWDEAERVQGVYSSNAIEGSTLTLGETEAVLRGATVPGKHLHDHLAAINLNHAWLNVRDWAKGPINERLLLDIHQISPTARRTQERGPPLFDQVAAMRRRDSGEREYARIFPAAPIAAPLHAEALDHRPLNRGSFA